MDEYVAALKDADASLEAAKDSIWEAYSASQNNEGTGSAWSRSMLNDFMIDLNNMIDWIREQ